MALAPSLFMLREVGAPRQPKACLWSRGRGSRLAPRPSPGVRLLLPADPPVDTMALVSCTLQPCPTSHCACVWEQVLRPGCGHRSGHARGESRLWGHLQRAPPSGGHLSLVCDTHRRATTWSRSLISPRHRRYSDPGSCSERMWLRHGLSQSVTCWALMGQNVPVWTHLDEPRV